MEILKREYTVEANKIKGFEKLEQDQASEIKDGNLFRFIVVLDDTRYTINAEGDPEITKDAQEEYDDFISKIRQKIMEIGKMDVYPHNIQQDAETVAEILQPYKSITPGHLAVVTQRIIE